MHPCAPSCMQKQLTTHTHTLQTHTKLGRCETILGSSLICTQIKIKLYHEHWKGTSLTDVFMKILAKHSGSHKHRHRGHILHETGPCSRSIPYGCPYASHTYTHDAQIQAPGISCLSQPRMWPLSLETLAHHKKFYMQNPASWGNGNVITHRSSRKQI